MVLLEYDFFKSLKLRWGVLQHLEALKNNFSVQVFCIILFPVSKSNYRIGNGMRGNAHTHTHTHLSDR